MSLLEGIPGDIDRWKAGRKREGNVQAQREDPLKTQAMEYHPIAEIFPLMNGEEFEAFKADIAANGLIEPIRTYEGKILDGRNRYRACVELGIEPTLRPWQGDSPVAFVRSTNLERRHLTKSQRAMAAQVALPLLEAEAKKRQGTRTDIREIIPEGLGRRPRDEAADRFGVNPRYISDAKKLTVERPDLAERVFLGEIELTQARRMQSEEKNKADLQRPVALALPHGLHPGDFRELSKDIPDDSVELIFTDPPYDEGSVHLYGSAAEVAARILKPGGSFVAYSGQCHLREVLNACAEHLRPLWTIATFANGGNQRMRKLGIISRWKPLVWFTKGSRGDVQNLFIDVVDGRREKDFHPWQQAECEAAYVIEHLTSPNGLVVDFFLGSGTTAVAAIKLGRPWIGYETNAATAEMAVERIANIGISDHAGLPPAGVDGRGLDGGVLGVPDRVGQTPVDGVVVEAG